MKLECLICRRDSFLNLSRLYLAQNKKRLAIYQVKIADKMERKIQALTQIRYCHACSADHYQQTLSLRKIKTDKQLEKLSKMKNKINVAKSDLNVVILKHADLALKFGPGSTEIQRLDIRISQLNTLVSQRERRLREAREKYFGLPKVHPAKSQFAVTLSNQKTSGSDSGFGELQNMVDDLQKLDNLLLDDRIK